MIVTATFHARNRAIICELWHSNICLRHKWISWMADMQFSLPSWIFIEACEDRSKPLASHVQMEHTAKSLTRSFTKHCCCCSWSSLLCKCRCRSMLIILQNVEKYMAFQTFQTFILYYSVRIIYPSYSIMSVFKSQICLDLCHIVTEHFQTLVASFICKLLFSQHWNWINSRNQYVPDSYTQ